MDVAAQFGDNLARVRKEADLSQDELSVRAAIHRTEVSQLERGLRVPRADTLVKLCVVLEADPKELLAGIGWRQPRIDIGNFESVPSSTASEPPDAHLPS
jgi:transcriptional regulator with XRE-family HTH domain